MAIDTLDIKENHSYRNIEIGEDNQHFHIEKIEVFTGDDESKETELIEITTNASYLNPKLIAVRKPKHKKLASGRLRGEPGVRIYLLSEDTHNTYCLEFYHHKGSVGFNSVSLGNNGSCECCNESI